MGGLDNLSSPEAARPHSELPGIVPFDWSSTPLGPIESWPRGLLYAKAVIDAAAQPMVVAWGPQRRMVFNSAFRPILAGKIRAAGEPLHEVFQEAWPAVAALFERAEGGESVFVEGLEAQVTRNGRTAPAWWNISYSPLPSRPGEEGGVLCILQEMTRLYLAEAGARAARAELTLVTDVVPSLLWRADRFGRMIWRNARLEALTRSIDADNVWPSLVHPDDLDAVTEGLRDAKLARSAFSRPMRLKTSDGEYRRHLALLEPTLDAQGALTGWCGVATDVQGSVDVMEVLDRRTALLAQFAENTASLIWTLDLETLAIERLSPNFTRIWPDLAPEAVWRWDQFLATVHEADRPTLEVGLERSAAGEAGGGKFRVVGTDGEIRLLDCSIFPIVTAEGRILHIGGALRDLTRRRSRVTHLVTADPASQNRLSHGLRKQGFEVTVFDSIEALADVASGMTPAPLVYHHQGDMEALARIAGLIRNSLPRDPWIVLQSGEPLAREAVAIMKLGACDILQIEEPIETIVAAIDTAASTIRLLSDDSVAPAARHRLTRREFEIARGLVAGGTNKTIGQDLGMSPRTVESHRGRLMERLGVATLAELVALVTSPSFEVDIRS